jgi:Carboxypeptidase regulatory-like domain/TonB dependent receptor-like, beta-barrel
VRQKLISLLVLLPGLALMALSATAQDTSTKGGITGSVVDATGAVVPGATVTISGPIGDRVAVTDAKGNYVVPNLIPGQYSVKGALTGFKTASVSNVTVYVGKDVSVKLTLTTGDISETIEVVGGEVTIDTATTAIGANINAQVFENLPVQRRVDNLFYLAPGVTESQAGGKANPSISGGSALDNLYVADGVNITDSSFGGLGVFSRVYGTLGVGINSSYIQDVQVKTGGFEPQYGQAQGGIVNIITKSGGREFKGSVYGYMQPGSLESTRKQPDDTRVNKVGEIRAEQNFDVGFDLGGPLVKDKLFFYGNFNPSALTQTVAGARNSGLAAKGEFDRKYTTYNYAAKLDWNLAANHQLNFSIFGDPSHTNTSSFNTLTIDNTTADSKLDYGTRNIAARYNGTLSNTWSLNITGSAGKNHFDETASADFNQIIDRTQPARGNFTAIGLGFIEPTNGTTYRASVDTTKQFSFVGNHTFAVGYQYQKGEYSGTRDRTGPHYEVPATNANGSYATPSAFVGQPLNAAWSLRPAASSCTLCPLVNRGGVLVPVYLSQDRGEFGQPVFDTFNNYNAYYAQDTWRMGKKVTLLLGLRGEQERIEGNPGSTGKRVSYSFTGQWSPRLGITIDPMGQGKTKLYYNFGRFHEYIPLDMAERSLSSEKDFTGGRFAPDFTIDSQGRRIAVINPYGTVTPVVDAAHLLNGGSLPGGAGGGPSFAAQDPSNPILPGTKLGYAQEHLIGFEQQIPGNLVLSVRYLNRQLKRIVEDAGLNPPEGTSFFSGVTYFIGNVSSKLDAGTNIIEFTYNPGDPLPAGCDPNLDAGLFTPPGGGAQKGACFAALGANGKPAASTGADGLPDGFPDVQHKYQAVEIELNKRFSHGWQLLANWRIAKVEGNFEGHFRNDNGQTDPAISSLFDFSVGQLGLLGDQFAVGPLNTDRKHVANLYGSYAFKGGQSLNIGGGLHLETGVPISQFYAHPIYLNAGEIPVGGRGALGRSDTETRVDLHADYPIRFSKRSKVVVSADFFNLFNSQPVRRTDQFVESSAGQLNPDFSQPGYAKGFGPRVLTSFYAPFSMRFGLKIDF